MADYDFVKNEYYTKHMSGRQKGYYTNFSRDIQSVYERFYYRRLSELAMSRFKWHNLPVSVDPRFLEQTLLNNGLAVFFQDVNYIHPDEPDNSGAFMALRASSAGGWNPTDNPTFFQVVGNKYPTRRLSAKECVPIWANYSRTPDLDVIQIYAHRLANTDRTIDINLMNARRTMVAFADENQRLSVENVIRQINSGEPVVRVTNPLQGQLDTVNFGVDPRSIEALHIVKVRLWNECMMLLGIQSANQDKKERLVADEVDANAEQIDLNRETALNARRLAADQINRKYGLNISVDFITQPDSMSPIEGM